MSRLVENLRDLSLSVHGPHPDKLCDKAANRIEELEAFITAEGEAHYSHREFEKMESERNSWQVTAMSITEDVKMLYEAAQEFHREYKSEAFGEIAYEELEKALDAVKFTVQPDLDRLAEEQK